MCERCVSRDKVLFFDQWTGHSIWLDYDAHVNGPLGLVDQPSAAVR